MKGRERIGKMCKRKKGQMSGYNDMKTKRKVLKLLVIRMPGMVCYVSPVCHNPSLFQLMLLIL